MQTSVVFREARLEDLPKIVEIYNSIIAGRMVTADLEPVTVAERLAWFHAHEPKSRPLWVVEDGLERIGWVSFQSFYGRVAYERTAEISIYLDEKSRGKGLGKIILHKAIAQAPSLGISNILGFIFGHNLPSLNLFHDLGFQTWGHLPKVAILDGIERDLLILGKKL